MPKAKSCDPWNKLFILIAIIVLIAMYFGMRHSLAADNGQWNHDPETSAWFNSLHSPKGTPCCDYADGMRIEDPAYKENDDGSFDIELGSEVIHVGSEKVIRGTNKVGYAILWRMMNKEVTCFLPGSGS